MEQTVETSDSGVTRTNTVSGKDEETEKGKSFLSIAAKFADATTAHGVSHIANSTSWLSKSVWVLTLVTVTCIYVFQCSELIQLYFRNPKSMSVEIVEARNQIFPAVTICNVNKVRRSAIAKSGYHSLTDTLDEPIYSRQTYSAPCEEGDYQCIDLDICLKPSHLCDGVIHCYDGWGEDEQGCDLPVKCHSGEFACTNAGKYGRCLPEKLRCDGEVHCRSGEDEINCNCYGDRPFKCHETQSGHKRDWCLGNDRVCNGKDDCYAPKDEEICYDKLFGEYEVAMEWLVPDEPEHVIDNFTTDQFHECTNNCDLSKECLAHTWDEITEECLLLRLPGSERIYRNTSWGLTAKINIVCNGFRCHTADGGECVPESYVCDSYEDCSDGSDESVCEFRECFENEFSCDNTKCISIHDVCDGEKQCWDETDEEDCTFSCFDTEFLCDEKTCISIYDVCDGFRDCWDGTDELNCVAENHTMDTTSVFDGDWFDAYMNLTDNPDVYEEFKENHYQKRQFRRVRSENPPDWKHLFAFSSSSDHSDIRDVLKFKPYEVAALGHRFQDLILQCSFADKSCNDTDFIQFEDDTYGNCYTFNHQTNGSEAMISRRAGIDFGLKLLLDVEADEYVELYGQNVGVRVLIHPHDISPFPDEKGITVKPGVSTSVGLKMATRSLLGGKYGSCQEREDFIVPNIYGNDFKYSSLACHKTCLQNHLLQYCDCVDTMVIDAPRCRLLNDTQDVCRQLIYYLYQRNILPCDCPERCNTTEYTMGISQAVWPSESSLWSVLHNIHHINRKTRGITNLFQARENLAILEIYFEDLNYEHVQELPAYEIEQLLGDVGGQLGFFTGVSVITVLEIMYFCGDVFKYVFRRRSVKLKGNVKASNDMAML